MKKNKSGTRTLNQMMEDSPFLHTENLIKKQIIESAFTQWVDETKFHEWFYSLYQFACQKPLSYFNPQIIDETLHILNSDFCLVIKAFSAFEAKITHAVLSNIRTGSSWENEELFSIEDPKNLVDFENIWHPEYIRYCEQIYNHIIQIPLFVIGQSHNGKKYNELTLTNRVQILSDNGYQCLTNGFNSTIRNALSHGHIQYGVMDITYIDRQKTEIISSYDFAEIFDNLVDTCNSIIIGFIIFICNNRSKIENIGLHNIPLGLRYLIIDGFTQTKNFRLMSLVESKVNQNTKQINIYCEIKSMVMAEQQYNAILLCWVVCKLGGKDYDRYVVSIDCGMPSTSLLILNGEHLYKAFENNSLLGDCAPKLIESSLMWYDNTGVFSRIRSFKYFAHSHLLLAKREIIKNFKNQGITFWGQNYKIVKIVNTSPRKLRRIQAHIILKYENPLISLDYLEKVLIHAIKKIRRIHIRKKDISGEVGLPWTPEFITIRLYSHDQRIRKLESYNWQNKELMLIAEWSSNWRKTPPFFTKDTNYYIKGIRIKLNNQLINE